MMAAELEFYVLNETYEQAHAKGYVDLKRFGKGIVVLELVPAKAG